MTDFTVSHTFDEYNVLIMKITYGEMTFKYTINESYLNKPEDWDCYIAYLRNAKFLEFVNADHQSWEDTLRVRFPAKYIDLYIAEIEKARQDPRIMNPVADIE